MTEIRIVEHTITVPELKTLAHEFYGDIIKAVVDVRQEIMGAGGEFHSEIERLLTEEKSSRREDTWGINLLLDKTGDDFIEFDSLYPAACCGEPLRKVWKPKVSRVQSLKWQRTSGNHITKRCSSFILSAR